MRDAYCVCAKIKRLKSLRCYPHSSMCRYWDFKVFWFLPMYAVPEIHLLPVVNEFLAIRITHTEKTQKWIARLDTNTQKQIQCIIAPGYFVTKASLLTPKGPNITLVTQTNLERLSHDSNNRDEILFSPINRVNVASACMYAVLFLFLNHFWCTLTLELLVWVGGSLTVTIA